MSQDCWLVVRGPLSAPLAALPSLYADLWMEHGGLKTHDDLDWNEIHVNPVSVHEVPGIEDLEAPSGSVAFNFSGRIPHPMHLPLLDALAPRGGVFVFEDGEVEEVDPATDPDAVVKVTQAAWAKDANALADALSLVPDSDHYRLPLKAIAWFGRSFDETQRGRLRSLLEMCGDVTDENESPFALSPEDEEALARMDRNVEATRKPEGGAT